MSVLCTERSRNSFTSRLRREASSARNVTRLKPVGLERLLDIVVGAALDGGDGRLDVAMTRNDHHGQIGMLLLDRRKHLEPVQPAALQPDIEDDERRPPLLDRGQRFVAVARQAGRVPLVLEYSRNEFADIGLVVDNQ